MSRCQTKTRTRPKFTLIHRPTYSQEDFERIAAAVGKDGAAVIRHKNAFEAAARWYRSDSKAPKGKAAAPSVVNKRMTLIANAARKLLRHLEVYDYRLAADGPGDRKLLQHIASAEDGTEDDVIRAVERVGRLVAVFEAVDAAREIERRASKAAKDAIQRGRLTTPRGHHGDAAVNEWIAAMISIYKNITGQNPRTSVGAIDRREQGKANGPLIRFLQAAGKPLGISLSADSLRARVRDLLRDARSRK